MTPGKVTKKKKEKKSRSTMYKLHRPPSVTQETDSEDKIIIPFSPEMLLLHPGSFVRSVPQGLCRTRDTKQRERSGANFIAWSRVWVTSPVAQIPTGRITLSTEPSLESTGEMQVHVLCILHSTLSIWTTFLYSTIYCWWYYLIFFFKTKTKIGKA